MGASINDSQVNQLLNSAGVSIPTPIRSQLYAYIKQTWQSRDGLKSVDALKSELSHECSKVFLSSQIPMLQQRLQSLKENLEETKEFIRTAKDRNVDAERKFVQEDYPKTVKLLLDETAKVFTEGFFTVFKDNFKFDKYGTPIGIKDIDTSRWGQSCVAKLDETLRIQSRKESEQSYGIASYIPKPPPLPSKGPLTPQQLAYIKVNREAVRSQTRTQKSGYSKKKKTLKRYKKIKHNCK